MRAAISDKGGSDRYQLFLPMITFGKSSLGWNCLALRLRLGRPRADLIDEPDYGTHKRLRPLLSRRQRRIGDFRAWKKHDNVPRKA